LDTEQSSWAFAGILKAVSPTGRSQEMKTNTRATYAWSTASFGGNAETSPMELSSLGDHLGACKSPRGHLFALRCASEFTRGFMASRFVTTWLAIALLIGIATFML
jgi:hypothetical protein